MYAEKYSKSSLQGGKMLGNRQCTRKNARKRQCTQKKCSESSIQSGKMLGIIDARGKNARNHRCTQEKWSKSPMKGVRMLGKDKVYWKMLGIVNARWKNARKRQRMMKNARNCQCKVKKYSETTIYTEKCSESSMQGQCKVWECSESSMQGARMLGIINARCKIARNRQCKE